MAWRNGQRSAARRLGRAAGRFARAEDGTLMIFGLFILLIMMMAAGLAVDTIRHERERVRVQATLDRAVLAAADLENDAGPERVVADYFAAAGLSDVLGEVEVVQGLGHKDVTASAAFDVPTVLLHMAGVDSLGVAATSRAKERSRDVEISLVLDVSNSMEKFHRLINLRRAATEFVEAVLPADRPPGASGLTTLSLVPYATSVNIGPGLMEMYDVERVHPYSNCVLFDDSDYDSISLPASRPLTQYEHFDPGNGGYIGSNPSRIARPLCPRAAENGGREVNLMIPASTDPSGLAGAIADLRPAGSTETDAGMRWGIAMLDPATRPVIDALVSEGVVDPKASGRPLDYGTENALKVVVLMTDGEPQEPYDLNPRLKPGFSNVWLDTVTGRYSVLLRGHYLKDFPYAKADRMSDDPCADAWPNGRRRRLERDGVNRVAAGNQNDEVCEPRWYWASSGRIRDHPDWSRADSTETRANRHPDWSRTVPADADPGQQPWQVRDGLKRLTNREVFDAATTPHAHYDFYEQPRRAGWLSGAEWSVLRSTHGGAWHRVGTQSGTVSRLLRMCSAAKDRGVLIFTIGFEIERIDTAAGRSLARSLMRDCATSPAHYFDVDDVAISEAFATIATQIGQVRLMR